jgi:hypothetical protein
MKFGIDYFGMMEKAKARRRIELFARHVMPRVR